jgi:hypothetical protein
MKNGKPVSLEQRLDRLEADVKEIKTALEAQRTSRQPTWRDFVGIFENDPVAEEVRKFTEEMREKERRKARRTRAKSKGKA